MIEVVADAALTASRRAELVALHTAAFGSGSGPDPALAPELVLLVERDELVAAATLLHKPIAHAGAGWRAVGLSAVATAPARRRQGHALAVVRAAFEHACVGGADLVLFSCDESLVGLYERAGAEVLAGSVIVGGTPDDELRSDELGPGGLGGEPKAVLWVPCTARATAARSALVGADIVVHPGPIDRLW